MELRVAGRHCRVATGQCDFTPAASRWPPIVLIHGAANDRDAWHAVVGGLTAAGCAVLAPDLPGHGLSEGPALASIEALADWLPQVLDAVGVSAAVVVGHSMGSLVALECAARHPQRVSRLALLGSSAPMPVSEALLGRATSDPDAVYRLMTEYSLTGGFRLRGGDRPGVWGPGLTLAILRRSPPGALAIDLAGCNAYQNGLEAAARVVCPTLLLVARRDRMTPRRNLPPLQSALREVTRVEIADCGHALMAERPDSVVRALLDFLQPPPATQRAASPPNARER
ncbi:alpha/beta fold hydrolase [Accumulibacter sp.]|uniref:alpha/beta fold hydrolase n=1 Tax=Accumulibacter sp. TaxID=2053492 RepID=UPI0025E6D09A|nr:alpha/beta hydrolase [Accumulibacter sp.]MCM8595644.1 alpha/beta hydrolase [Accumulibacter sp.]MCM8626037.1 alpha/beta hydrolase [Accumulibacter sp.]MDS4049791.1 alpha/beta hydrolase [Accumulibacter sp.]